MGQFTFLTIFVATFYFQIVHSQYFNPNMTDQAYLDVTHDKVKCEVVQTRRDLVDQAEVVEQATRAYIEAKIKENLFKALRTLAERELETLSMQNRPRQPRQEEEDEEETTTETGLIPALAEIVKAIFGGNVNVTKYVESASKLLPRPIGNQLIGVVSLLDPNQFTTTKAPRIVPTPTPGPVNGTILVPQYITANGVGVPQYPQSAQFQTVKPVVISQTRTQPAVASETTSRTGGEDDDYDGIRLDRTAKQFQGVNPMQLLNGMEALWNSLQPNKTATAVPSVKAGGTTESEDGFDDDFTTKPSRGAVVIKGVMTQAQNLRKGVPDLFEGAREAYKFLETLNGFLDKWSARLAAGSAEEEE